MKKNVYKPVIILLLALFIGNACSKDDTAPIDKLPPATQTGENTAGCLLNGKAFLPKGSALSGPVLSAFYQYLYGEYFFSVSFKNNKEEHLRSIIIAACTVELQEGGTYPLVLRQDNGTHYTTNFGEYLVGGGLIDRFETTNEITGELTITKLDTEQLIISGTFWFDAVNEEGEIVEIREGRFDMQYAN